MTTTPADADRTSAASPAPRREAHDGGRRERTATVPRPTITLDAARAALDAGIAAAGALGVAVALAVADPGGNDVAFAAMDGAPLLSRDVARDKAWTAVAFGQPTTWWVELLAGAPELAALGGNNRLMPVPGGIPLLVGGAVAGAVGVSGGTPEQDVEIATAALAAVDQS